MNKEEIFIAWAPEESVWAPWVKAVLFAHMDMLGAESTAVCAFHAPWVPPVYERHALILDMPGPEAVFATLELMKLGYRPVPLYNAVPLPSGEPALDAITGRTVAAVDVLPTMQALKQCAAQMGNCKVPPDAPPAFLLDSSRHADNRSMDEGEFDNRSVCFTADFPSANFLHANGIQRALLVQRGRLEPREDLGHVLRRWQDGGIALARVQIDALTGPEAFQIPKPPWYRAMFQRALVAFGLRRAPEGGFGAWMPDSSSSG